MSIPPLVCNTPPPLDQCDDENDQDEYEINYCSSQEEDSINDDFANYTSINYKPPVLTLPDSIYNAETVESKQINCKMKTLNPVLEDLDLKLESLVVNDVKSSVPEDCISNKSDVSEQSSKSDLATSYDVKNDETCTSGIKEDDLSKGSTDSGFPLTNENTDLTFISDDVNTNNKENVSIDNTCFDENTDYEIKVDPNTQNFKEISEANMNKGVMNENEFHSPGILDVEEAQDFMSDELKENKDNEKIVPSVDASIKDTTAPSVATIDMFETLNESNKKYLAVNLANDDEFSDLSSKSIPIEPLQRYEDPWAQQESAEEFGNFQATFEDSSINENIPNTFPMSEDDDFGDFDDFQSVAPISEDKFNINSIVSEELVENILSSIFPETIIKSENILMKTFEMSLGTTWRYLKETDERQPYIVNWNASIGQKDLLKALCIDSRNILITPKWSHNMPKYAANLNNVPLQPKKPTLQDNTSIQRSTKTNESWTDPFVSEGPESTQLQSSNNETKLKPAETVPHSIKDNEIFSSTPALQPIRQISLPETHIFTPTDSEIPRSKTHYNISTPIEMNESEIKSQQQEYSDFQDFKSASGKKEDQTEITQISGMSILQPVKTELILPTLNWPDPGQVKETFDDFTDFVSNTSWTSSEVKSSSINIAKPINNDLAVNTVNDQSYNQIHTSNDIPLKRQELELNTFDVFPRSNSTSNMSSQAGTRNSHINKITSKNILSKPIQADAQILQPISKPAKSVGQILQPLSLESYSQINWPNPGIDLQNLSRFNPIETLPSLKGESSAPGSSKNSPAHMLKTQADDDFWGDFVSSKPAQVQSKSCDDEEWSDFMSSPTVHNGLNTISLNVHNNKSIKNNPPVSKHLDIPSLDYVMPKATPSYNDNHLNL